MKKIHYRKLSKSERKKTGYKYQLENGYTLRLGKYVKPCDTDYINISKCGLMTIRNGYCWDGPSGPSFDTKSFMRGSLVHDAFYQLIREGHIKPKYKKYADTLLRRICIEDGMWRFRAAYVYQAVKLFGHRYCKAS